MPSQSLWSPSSTAKVGSGYRRERTWVITPNYRTLPKSQLPENPYSDFRNPDVSQDFWNGQYTINNSTGVKTVYAAPQYYHTVASLVNEAYAFINSSDFLSIAASADNSDQIKVLGRAADTKVNVAVTLAEADKTIFLILGTARRLDRAYRAFRALRFGEVATLLNIRPRNVHKTWLEYKYGWMPLLMDVKGSAEAFAQHVVGRPPKFTVNTNTTVEISYSCRTYYTPFGGTSADAFSDQTLNGSYTCRHKMELSIANSNHALAQQLGLTNPALIAWELVPFSFVFDWFISVGNWLQALTAMDGLNLNRGMRSNLNNLMYYGLQPNQIRQQGSVTYYGFGFNRHVKINDYARSPFAPSALSLYPPSNISSLNFTKLLTSLALLKAQRR